MRVGDGREFVRVVADILSLRVGVVDQGLDLVVDVDGSHGSDVDPGMYWCSVAVVSRNPRPMVRVFRCKCAQ